MNVTALENSLSRIELLEISLRYFRYNFSLPLRQDQGAARSANFSLRDFRYNFSLNDNTIDDKAKKL